MRVAVVGLGEIAAKAYLPLLSAWEGIELLLFARRSDAVAQLRAHYRLPHGTSDWSELLSWRPETAFVLTPSHTHYELAAGLIEAGVDVFLRFFCGEAEPVSTVGRVRDGRLVSAASLVALEAGGHGLVVTSLEAGRWSESYVLHGAGASLEVEAFLRARLIAGGEERVLSERPGSWRPSLEARGFPQQIAHFFECVTTRRQPSTSAWEAHRTQRLLEEMIATPAYEG